MQAILVKWNLLRAAQSRKPIFFLQLPAPYQKYKNQERIVNRREQANTQKYGEYVSRIKDNKQQNQNPQ